MYFKKSPSGDFFIYLGYSALKNSYEITRKYVCLLKKQSYICTAMAENLIRF